jgi:hypothetical protein
MHSTIWGWMMWRLMHLVSFTYPDVPTELDKKMYMQFYISIGSIIPCKVCRLHYKQRININNMNITFNKKKKVILWLIAMHNEVNIGLNKQQMNYAQAYSIYMSLLGNMPYFEIYKIIGILNSTVHKKYSHSEITSNINFYNSLKHVLPCPDMKQQYIDIVTEYPISVITVFDRSTLQVWYHNIKVKFEKDLLTKNIKYYIKYKIFNKKNKRTSFEIFKPNLINIKSLSDIIYTSIGESTSNTHNILQKIILLDDTTTTIQLYKKISKQITISNPQLIAPINEKIRIISKRVPKKMRS